MNLLGDILNSKTNNNIVASSLSMHIDSDTSFARTGNATSGYVITDLSTNKYNGKAYRIATPNGGPIKFENNAFADFGNIISGVTGTNVSYEFFVNPHMKGTDIHLFGKSNSSLSTDRFSFGISSQDKPYFYTVNSIDQRLIAVTTSTVSINTWQHIVFTFNGGESSYLNRGKIYVNSVLQPITYGAIAANNNAIYPATGASATFSKTTSSLRRNYYSQYYFGLFRAYSKTLTPTEITQNFNAQKSRFGI